MCPKAFELELIQSHMAQKPVLRGKVGCACVARKVSAERGGMGMGLLGALPVHALDALGIVIDTTPGSDEHGPRF